MTVVFVHGVPETAALWDRLRARIGGDSVALALPGFGTPRPSGFGATMDEYADWLAAELKGIDGPIDLVGHDWGGMLTTRVMTTSAAAVRSWVTDAITIVDPSFEWHDLAKIWQTPGDGEAFWASMLAAPPEDTAPLFAALGVPEADALALVSAINETTTACILDLYRSSANIGTDWARVRTGERAGHGDARFRRSVRGRGQGASDRRALRRRRADHRRRGSLLAVAEHRCRRGRTAVVLVDTRADGRGEVRLQRAGGRH